MQIQEYFDKKEQIRNHLLGYLDNEDDEENASFNDFIRIIKDQKIDEIRDELKQLLHLLNKISNNYHRTPKLFDKFEKIFQHFKKDINQHFSNSEIFNIFQNNKRVILMLFDLQIITPDEYIGKIMQSHTYIKKKYLYYFFPEIKNFITHKRRRKIDVELKKLINDNINTNNFFDTKRKIGENDHYICHLIRNDLFDDFISYINKNNIALNSKIEPSLFETNDFLLRKSRHSLIQYSAFFGSIQIFKYLLQSQEISGSSIWIYSIHSKCPEILYLLQEKKILVDYQILIESLKCHDNDMTSYIMDTMSGLDIKNDLILTKSIDFLNYFLLPVEVDKNVMFYNLCKLGKLDFVKAFYDSQNPLINEIIVLQKKYFFF